MAKKNDVVGQVAVWLVIIGAVNWGLVGALGLDLVNLIFGSIAILARLVYVLVGLAGLYQAYKVVKG